MMILLRSFGIRPAGLRKPIEVGLSPWPNENWVVRDGGATSGVTRKGELAPMIARRLAASTWDPPRAIFRIIAEVSCHSAKALADSTVAAATDQ